MMRFKSDIIIKSRIIETEYGVTYRTNMEGTSWERLYGESWEPVFLDEEKQCIEEFTRYFYNKLDNKSLRIQALDELAAEGQRLGDY
jgi:hypothetical protein